MVSAALEGCANWLKLRPHSILWVHAGTKFSRYPRWMRSDLKLATSHLNIAYSLESRVSLVVSVSMNHFLVFTECAEEYGRNAHQDPSLE